MLQSYCVVHTVKIKLRALACTCNANTIAMGVVIQVNETLVEDASRIRWKSDSLHIIIAELEAIGRGINLTIQWGFCSFTVATDTWVVVSWLDNATVGRDCVRARKGPFKC